MYPKPYSIYLRGTINPKPPSNPIGEFLDTSQQDFEAQLGVNFLGHWES